MKMKICGSYYDPVIRTQPSGTSKGDFGLMLDRALCCHHQTPNEGISFIREARSFKNNDNSALKMF